ncbi:alpha/beta hydrolase family protein [Sinosporangium siamense]|uniref:Lipase n=1 Tax=Sinosporangium siamense TaxID=1367973 RepID=A0A919RQW3_9ACTN|nr:lipase [Sinosporangium siamense]GII96791.1 lipase [Sinosporangium siamense]
MDRRLFLTAVVLSCAVACAPAAPYTLNLPAPTGPHPVGTRTMRLEDGARTDPWTGGRRELMISVWYPARTVQGFPVAPWMPADAAKQYLEENGLTDIRLDRTHGHEGAPVTRALGRLPVVLYSPGLDASRSYGTAVVQELASRGFVVVTIDHTHDAAVVSFPGGRVVLGRKPSDLEQAVAVRIADVRFVLDRLTDLNREDDLYGLLDLDRIGMFGHSLGAWTTSATMLRDRRIRAGMGLDGAKLGAHDSAPNGLSRPFLLVDTPGKGGMATNPAVRRFWEKLSGWRLHLTIRGAAHNSMGDDVVLIRAAAGRLGLSQAELTELVGTIAPEQAQAFQRAYPAAFFEQHLLGKPAPLLEGPSAEFPEVSYRR